MAAMFHSAGALTRARIMGGMLRAAIRAETMVRGCALGLLLAAAPLTLGQAPRASTALQVHVSDIHDQEDGPAAGGLPMLIIWCKPKPFL